jgi:hypothetical protein
MSGSVVRGVLIVVAVVATLAVLRYKPWQQQSVADRGRERLTVGFLPVT